MNRNLRLKIKKSLDEKQVSENLCFLCLACLNNKITYSKQIQHELEKQRNIIASALLKNGTSKEILIKKMRTISANDYPTFRTITTISKMIESNNYSFSSGFIPDKMIHYKNETELEEDAKRIIPKKKFDIPEPEKIKASCDWIKEHLSINITDNMKKKLKSFEQLNSYNVFLQCCLWYEKNIITAITKKAPFESEYSKFTYFLGIVKNHMQQTEEIIERKQKQNEEYWLSNAQAIIDGDESLESMIHLMCEKYTDSAYYGQNEYVREELKKAMDKLKSVRE